VAEIAPARQDELLLRLTWWDPPFDGVKLTRADIEWLLLRHDGGRGPVKAEDPNHRGRAGLDLRGADVRGVDLAGLELAHLRGAGLRGGLSEAEWSSASDEVREENAVHAEGADLFAADLTGADLVGAHFEKARLTAAHLEDARLHRAHLEGANLIAAHLEGTKLNEARFAPTDEPVGSPADLRLAYFSQATALRDATMCSSAGQAVRLADVRWGDANLAGVDWDRSSSLATNTPYAKRRPPRVGAGRIRTRGITKRPSGQIVNSPLSFGDRGSPTMPIVSRTVPNCWSARPTGGKDDVGPSSCPGLATSSGGTATAIGSGRASAGTWE
jgi:uncharacterized protein YjbI with pentapeptide repeats